MGLVYYGHDLVLDRPVALKTLRSLDPEEMYRLKKEFRSLAKLSHPNLVQLYDLVVTTDQCFFTMELISGADFLQHVRQQTTPLDSRAGTNSAITNVDLLRDALQQLAVGLHALHVHGKLHRDIKPTNVLVEASGRVVLLDFGLVTDVTSRESRHSQRAAFAGTLAYMAPEQAWGEPLSPAADWYGVGVMLYEALTGRLPFDGPALQALIEKRAHLPPSPRTLASNTPEDLDALTMELLQPEPGERPSEEEIAARLAANRPREAGASGPSSAALENGLFVGRSAEIEILRDAFQSSSRHGFATVNIEGTSGIGKTTLVEHFLSTIEGEGTLILRTRCYPHETVPFKAIDGLVDALARFLTHEPAAEVEAQLPRNMAALTRIFPVFGRVQAVAGGRENASGAEPHEIRRRAFVALRELLGRIADRRQLVLWIDDLQWGDLDSAAILRELGCPPDPPSLLLLLSFNEDPETNAIVQALTAANELVGPTQPLREIHLGPLSIPETRRLAVDVAGSELPEVQLDSIVREADGSPFFIAELARHIAAERSGADDSAARPADLSSVVSARIERLPSVARQLLEIIAVAGEPVQEELAYNIGKASARSDASRALALLRNGCLLRTVFAEGQNVLDTYHSRIREAVVALLPPESQKALHARLAEALEELPHVDSHRLVEHHVQAGNLKRAGEYAFRSAESAFKSLAFNRAASLYRRALELTTTACDLWELRSKLAEALVNAGRGAEGAESYVAAAEERARQATNDLDVLRLKRLAAEQYLRSGLYEDGLRVLRQVLAAVDLPYAATSWGALSSLIVKRLRLKLQRRIPRRNRAIAVGEFDRERLEICWAAGLGLGVSDSLRAADFQVRHALLTHGVGDTVHTARALATEGLLSTWEGGERKRRRGARLRLEAERLARVSGNPNVRAYSLTLRSVSAFFERRLREALSLAEDAEALCRNDCVGAEWELANAQMIGAVTLAFLGEFGRLRQRLPEVLRQAHERGDLYCLFMGRLGFLNGVWLAADQPHEARRHAEAAFASAFPSTFTWPIYQGVLAQAQIDLYEGDGQRAWERIPHAWRRLRAGGMLRFQPVRIEMRELRARCAITLASAGRLEQRHRQRILRFAAREARRIAAEDAPWAAGFADTLRAGVAAVQSDSPTATSCLERAALEFDHAEMNLHAAAAQYQLGLLIGGEGGDRVRLEQEVWMNEHGVCNAARMASTLVPGIHALL